LALGVLITLAGVQYQNVGVMLFGTLVGGTGFGTGLFRNAPERAAVC